MIKLTRGCAMAGAVALVSAAFVAGATEPETAGDMGQIHQHLVLFNHIALDHEAIFLEHIPHLQDRFTEPVRIIGARYSTPQLPGTSCELK